MIPNSCEQRLHYMAVHNYSVNTTSLIYLDAEIELFKATKGIWIIDSKAKINGACGSRCIR